MSFHSIIVEELFQAAHVLESFMGNEDNLKKIEAASKVLADSINAGGKVISCGNGGSHCDAVHFAIELTGKYREHRKAIPAICISDPSHISCVSNDYGYEFVFSR